MRTGTIGGGTGIGITIADTGTGMMRRGGGMDIIDITVMGRRRRVGLERSWALVVVLLSGMRSFRGWVRSVVRCLVDWEGMSIARRRRGERGPIRIGMGIRDGID